MTGNHKEIHVDIKKIICYYLKHSRANEKVILFAAKK